MRKQSNKLRFSIFTLRHSRNYALACLNHLRYKSGESSLILTATQREHHIHSSDEMMSGNTLLIGKAKHFELLFYIAIYAHSYIFRSHWPSTIFLFFHIIVIGSLWFFGCYLALEHCLVFLGDGNELFAVEICFSLIGRFYFVLFRIVDLCICSLQADS